MMKYGLHEDVIHRIIQVFRSFTEIDEATIYGSRAKGNYKPASDIDLTLKGDLLTHTILNKIRLALDDLNLPYTFDISIYEKIQNVDLIEHIKRVGHVFYSKTINNAFVDPNSKL